MRRLTLNFRLQDHGVLPLWQRQSAVFTALALDVPLNDLGFEDITARCVSDLHFLIIGY